MKNRHVFYIGNEKKRFIFIFTSGDEHAIMGAVLDMVFNEDLDFCWEEAAFIAFDIIDKLVDERESRDINSRVFLPPP